MMIEFAVQDCVSAADRRWQNWIEKVEDMLGHVLAGEQLLAAHEEFRAGACVVEYVLDAQAGEIA